MEAKDFEREDRYAVIKYKKLTVQQWTQVPKLLEKFDSARVDCVVVEKDWPEYRLVWAMLEHRMAGNPVPDFNLWSQADDLQQRLTVAERRESEAREELLDLSRKLDVFYSRSHGIKNLSAIEDANDKSKALQQRLTVAEQRNADNLKLISGLVEYADNLLADVNNAWSYAGSTGDPETHKDEDYAAALNLLSATVSSHE